MGIRAPLPSGVFNAAKFLLKTCFRKQNGFKIAVNILNIGRIKLVQVYWVVVERLLPMLSSMPVNVNSLECHQYLRAITKLAEMAVRTYACESLCYRAGGM